MESSRKFLKGMFDKGGVLAIGIISVMTYKKFNLSNLVGAISYGVTTFGACGFAKYLIVDFYMKDADRKHKEFLCDLDKLPSIIEEKIRALEEKKRSYDKLTDIQIQLEDWTTDSIRIEKIMDGQQQKKSAVNTTSEISSSAEITDVEKQGEKIVLGKDDDNTKVIKQSHEKMVKFPDENEERENLLKEKKNSKNSHYEKMLGKQQEESKEIQSEEKMDTHYEKKAGYEAEENIKRKKERELSQFEENIETKNQLEGNVNYTKAMESHSKDSMESKMQHGTHGEVQIGTDYAEKKIKIQEQTAEVRVLQEPEFEEASDLQEKNKSTEKEIQPEKKHSTSDPHEAEVKYHLVEDTANLLNVVEETHFQGEDIEVENQGEGKTPKRRLSLREKYRDAREQAVNEMHREM